MGLVEQKLFEHVTTDLQVVDSVSKSVESADASPAREQALQSSIIDHRATLETALKSIFPNRQEENRILKARRIMGDDVKELSDEELEVYLTEFQYLMDCWFDAFEKQIFNNLTLKQLLKED